jgi:hypothetical protein
MAPDNRVAPVAIFGGFAFISFCETNMVALMPPVHVISWQLQQG